MSLTSRGAKSASSIYLAVREPAKLRKLIESEFPGYVEKKLYQDKGEDSQSLLHSAVLADNIESAGILLEYGADINDVDSLGKTPLILACSEGNEELAKFLIHNGADLNIQDKDGQNCAHWAFCMEHLELGMWLVTETDVDTSAVDADGRTPLDWKNLVDLDELENKTQDAQEYDVEVKSAESDEELSVSQDQLERDNDEYEDARLANAKKESQAFVINGEENNFAAGTGLRATRWLRKSDTGILSCDN